MHGAVMSIEHENFDNILQHKDEKDLEQYGVWVKKPAEEEAKKKKRKTILRLFYRRFGFCRRARYRHNSEIRRR